MDKKKLILNSCSQDFSKMNKEEKGFYCKLCSKHLIDFRESSKKIHRN